MTFTRIYLSISWIRIYGIDADPGVTPGLLHVCICPPPRPASMPSASMPCAFYTSTPLGICYTIHARRTSTHTNTNHTHRHTETYTRRQTDRHRTQKHKHSHLYFNSHVIHMHLRRGCVVVLRLLLLMSPIAVVQEACLVAVGAGEHLEQRLALCSCVRRCTHSRTHVHMLSLFLSLVSLVSPTHSLTCAHS